MHPAILRVLTYLTIGFACYGVAVFFAAEGAWFVLIFGAGALIAFTGELLLLRHLGRITWRRLSS